MIKNKMSLLLAGAVAFSTIIAPINQGKTVYAVENVSNQNTKEEDFVFLSTLNYESNSKVGYGSIEKDKNTDKNKIRILVGGESLELDRGIGAHADSTLIYNVSKYSDKYSRLVTYLGVDYSYTGKGNGVKFKISKSEDGKKWETIEETGTILASDNAKLVDIDISNVKYLKLEADDLNNKTADHAVYGNAMLVKKGADVSFKYSSDILTVAEYDEQLKNQDVDYNYKNNKNIILKRELVNQVGYQNIQKLYRESDKYKNAITYLINNEQALEYFVASGGVAKGGSYINALKYFADIYEKHSKDLEDSTDNYFNLRLAMSVSLAYGNTGLVRFWAGGNAEISSVKRYETYQALVESGKMDRAGNTNDSAKWSTEQFKNLTIPLMKWVVDSRMNEDEFEWLSDYALDQKSKKRSFLDAYNYIKYGWGYNYGSEKFYSPDNKETYNNKYDFENYYDTYGNKSIRRLWMVFEDGSVCGGLAKTYANLAETFGRPSSGLGQPGHAATATYMYNNKTNQYEWKIQNDISGWEKSGNEFNDRMLNWGNKSWNQWQSASYIALSTDAIETEEEFANYRKATIYNLLANSYDNLAKKELSYEKAISAQRINLDAYEGLIKTYKANENKTSSDYYKLAVRVTETYAYYPLAMHELTKLIKPSITSDVESANLNIIITNKLNRAKVATIKDVKQPDICKTMANALTGQASVNLATFSFNGDNANTIVINSQYDESEIMVRYSIDGGKNWKQTKEHSIKLTDKEVDMINETDDIRVGLVGTSDYYTINITKATQPNNKNIFKNELENRFIGSTNNLEYSFDGEKWVDYTADTRFNGDVKVKLRYKSNGTSLKSDISEFTFIANTDTDDNKYITIDNIKSASASSQQSNSTSHKATNMVDGNYNTTWHTSHNGDSKKHYIVEFKDVKKISSVDYVPAGVNGRLKSAKIYTSSNGTDWVESGSITKLPNNESIKNIKLTKPTETKFVKIVATETYGNYEAELNKYFSGKAFNFYEDKTVESKIEVTDNTETNSTSNENKEVPYIESKIEYTESNIEVTNNTENNSTSNENKEVPYIESKIEYTE